jgi:hypothetical protein
VIIRFAKLRSLISRSLREINWRVLWVRKILDRESEKPWISLGHERKKVLRKRTCSEECSYTKWYQSGNISLLSIAEKRTHHAT